MTSPAPPSPLALPALPGGASLAALRADLEPRLGAEVDHAVYHRTVVDWERCEDLSRLWVNLGRGFKFLSVPEVFKAMRMRAQLIAQMEADPLRHGWEPEMWRQIDLRMARKRLEHPGVVLELLVTGGIRSGKTQGCNRRLMANFLYTEDAKIWVLDETETSSKRWHQPPVHRVLPPELQSVTGRHKKDLTTKLNFSEGSGFTDNMFNIHWECQDETGRKLNGGGMWEFRFYGADIATLQGAELTCANSDELVPKAVCDTIRERLLSRAQDTARPAFVARIRKALAILEAGGTLPLPLLGALYHSVHLISFTPKEGYSTTVADFMDGALTIDTTDTRVLPDGVNCNLFPEAFLQKHGAWSMEHGADSGPDSQTPCALPPAPCPELLPGKLVPRFKQPKKPTRLIAYLHTYDNPFKGNWPGMVADCLGKPEDEVRIIAYGDVQKNWNIQFSLFRDDHHVLQHRDQIPRAGTWRVIIDPARTRPWAFGFVLTAADGRRLLVREWPQEGAPIPEVGDPGAWAVVSRSGKKNGDRGPAQDLALKWTVAQYNRELWRLRMELGAWWLPKEDNAPLVKLTWRERPDWPLEGRPIEVAEVLMDSRFSTTRIFDKTLLEEMEECENPQCRAILEAPGDRLDEGDQLIINALGSYDAKQQLGPMNTPSLQIWHECHGTLFAMRNFSLDPFRENTKATDEACKDFRDILAMSELDRPVYLPPRKQKWTGGGTF